MRRIFNIKIILKNPPINLRIRFLNLRIKNLNKIRLVRKLRIRKNNLFFLIFNYFQYKFNKSKNTYKKKLFINFCFYH